MTFHRAVLVASAIVFTAAMTSVASACCQGPFAGPAVYAPPAPPPFYAGGCGRCGPVAFVAPLPPVRVPVWGCGGCAGTYVEPTPIAPAPIYVVNQGPDFSGPGIMVPFHTYSPAAAFSPAVDYPYVPSRYSYGPGYAAFYFHHRVYGGARYAYRRHWRHHAPLQVRD
jgi:hypothetical protein